MAWRRPSSRSTVLVVAGVAGVVLAHGLDYLLVIRAPAERSLRLAETGHGWWPAAVGAAFAAALLAVSMATAGGAAGAVFRGAARGGSAPVGRDVGWMVLWQVGVFTAVEVVERLGAHHAPLDLLRGPLFPVGLVLQVAVAALVVAGLRWLERAGQRVAGAALAARGSRRRGTRRPLLFPTALAVGAGVARYGRHEARGPPISAVS